MKRIDPTLDAAKRNAALRAVEAVENKMVLGLGSGSTASIAIELIGQRVAQGLEVIGIPTSERTAALARKVGIPLTDFSRQRWVDLTIDGADQIEEGRLSLIKGLGGALLREKIVAKASKRMIVVADHTKLVKQLGPATPLPVEIVPFGSELTIQKLQSFGCAVELRRVDGRPFVTDGGNFIADCTFQAIPEASRLQLALKGITGVVETGLFVNRASEAILGSDDGVTVLDWRSESRRRQIETVKALEADPAAKVACPICSKGTVRIQDAAPSDGSKERILTCTECDFISFIRRTG